MREFIGRLSSRKFLLAVAAFLAAVANDEWGVALGVVLGYLGVEGAKDAIEARGQPYCLISSSDQPASLALSG